MSEFRKLLEEINELKTDEEIMEFVKKRIEYLEQNSEVKRITNVYNREDGTSTFIGNNYEGYINSDSPIVTSLMVDPFYVDDLNLYVEFIKQIQNKDMSNLLTIFYEFNKFTKELFGFKGNQANRDQVYLLERDRISIADFYHNKSALCSERSASVHNIFSFLGIKSNLIIGNLEVEGKNEAHVYIIVEANDGTLILFDPTNPVALEYEGNLSFVPAYTIIGKQNINDLEEIDFDFKTLENLHHSKIDSEEKPRKYKTYKYELNKQK